MDGLLARIKKEFPEVTWTSARLRDEGWDHFAVILDDSLVFRLPKNKVEDGYFSNEIALLELVASRTSVRMPKVTHVSRDKTIIGCEYLPGDQLDLQTVANLDHDSFEAVAEQLAQFLSDLHVISPEECQDRSSSRRRYEDETKWLSDGYPEHLKDRLPAVECEIIENYIEELESCISSCLQKVLLHGDLAFEHILLDRKEKRISIIDFSDWTFGDPALDFCGLYDWPPLAREVHRRYKHGDDSGDLLARASIKEFRFA